MLLVQSANLCLVTRSAALIPPSAATPLRRPYRSALPHDKHLASANMKSWPDYYLCLGSSVAGQGHSQPIHRQ
jgi:hypothetical protein